MEWKYEFLREGERNGRETKFEINLWGEVIKMKDEWEEKLLCVTQCSRCHGRLDQRILSVYDHQVICMECKKGEEERPDYNKASKDMIRQCLVDTERHYGDPEGFCYHHFYPYTC
jgi:hypothetical protein